MKGQGGIPEAKRLENPLRVMFEITNLMNLYREKLENFLSDWPDAAITAVEDPAFHRAAVLTGDQGVSLFLARRGNVVFSVWTNADLDLTTYIEAFAAILAAEGGA